MKKVAHKNSAVAKKQGPVLVKVEPGCGHENLLRLDDVSFEDLIELKLQALLKRVEGYPLDSLHEEVMSLVERPLLRQVLAHTSNNQVQAAKILGLSRNTLRRRLQSFGLGSKRRNMLRAKSSRQGLSGVKTVQKRRVKSEK